MFNMSGSEMFFLLLLALIILGPDKLPDAMRRAGKAYGEFKKISTGFQTELKNALDEPMREMRETATTLQQAASLDQFGEQTAPKPQQPAPIQSNVPTTQRPQGGLNFGSGPAGPPTQHDAPRADAFGTVPQPPADGGTP